MVEMVPNHAKRLIYHVSGFLTSHSTKEYKIITVNIRFMRELIADYRDLKI